MQDIAVITDIIKSVFFTTNAKCKILQLLQLLLNLYPLLLTLMQDITVITVVIKSVSFIIILPSDIVKSVSLIFYSFVVCFNEQRKKLPSQYESKV